MSFFIGIGCSWLLVAAMMLWAHKRAENPETGQWRAEPSTFFGGPVNDAAAAEPTPSPAATGGPRAA